MRVIFRQKLLNTAIMAIISKLNTMAKLMIFASVWLNSASGAGISHFFESLFHIRHEDGTVQFFEKPLDPNVFAKVVLVKEEGELVPIEGQDSMEKIKMVRTNAKKKVFVTNAIRSLAKVSPTGNVRDIEFVVLVGGSALDFEVPTLVTDALSQYNIVAGRGNIRGCEGPRNAVATGLAMSCADV